MDLIEFDDDTVKKNKLKRKFYLMFDKKVEKEVIDMVLDSCNYDEPSAYESLLVMAGDMMDDHMTETITEPHFLTTNRSLTTTTDNRQTSAAGPSNLLEQLSASPRSTTIKIPPSISQVDSSIILAVSPKANDGSLFPSTADRKTNTILTDNSLQQFPHDSFPTVSPSSLMGRGPNSSLNPSFSPDRVMDKGGMLPQSILRSNIAGRSPQKNYHSPKTDAGSRLADTELLKLKLNTVQNYFLVIMRGLPGSGKSYKARQLCGERGIILSTDDFFIQNGVYLFDKTKLTDAHMWNKSRAITALLLKKSPIFIDNTNTQDWEMKPYVALGHQYRYEMMILEPDTDWAWKPGILARKNSHKVPKEAIGNMLERYQKNITVLSLLKSPLNSPKFNEKHYNNRVKNNPSHSNDRNNDKPHYSKHSAGDSNNRYEKNKPANHIQKLSLSSPRNQSHVTHSNHSNDTADVRNQTSMNVDSDRNETNAIIRDNINTNTSNEKKIVGNSDKQNTLSDEPVSVRKKDLMNYLSNDEIHHLQNVDIHTSASSNIESPYLPRISDQFTQATSHSTAPLFTDSHAPTTTHEILPPSPDHTFKKMHQKHSSSKNKSKLETQSSTALRNLDLQVSPVASSPIKSNSASAILPSSENHTLERQHSGRIGDIVNNFKDWSSKSVDKIDLSNSIDENTPVDIDIVELTEKSEQLKMRPKEVPSEMMEFSLQFLYECFPDCTKSYCKKWLKRYNGDIVKTCDYLSRLSQVDDLPDIIEISDNEMGDEKYTFPPELPPDTEEENLLDLALSKSLSSSKKPAGELYFCDTVAEDDSQLKIALDARLGKELLKKFNTTGGIQEWSLSYEDYIVDLDKEFAQQLFTRWMSSVKAKKRKLETLLNDDEQYALQLQQEENRLVQDGTDGRGKSKKKKLKPLHVDTEFSKNSPAQLKGGLFSPKSPWKISTGQDNTGDVKLKDISGLTLTAKQFSARKNLHEMFPGVDETDLDQVLEASSYNIDAATALVCDSCGIPKNNLKKSQASHVGNDWRVVESPPKKKMVPDIINIEDAPGSSDQTNKNLLYQTMSEDNQDYQDFRAEANLHANLRAECYQKAAKAFQDKRGEVAQYYADKARQHTVKMKEAHARAAEVTLFNKNKEFMKEQKVIDLHGLHAQEAVNALKNFLDNARNVGHRNVQVITGRGKHSKGGFSTIKHAVLNVLNQRKIRYNLSDAGGAINIRL